MSDFLFGTSALPSVTTTDTSNTTYPSWYQSYLNAIMGKASSIAGQPYQPYTGTRIAPQTADTQAAYSMVRNNVGAEQPMLNQANQYITNAGAPITGHDINQYLNPYTDNVVNSIAKLGQRNLTENLLPQVNDTFTRAGTFGSRGNADFTQRAVRDTNESILNQQNAALQSGYGQALTAAQQAKSQELGAGQGLSSLAQTGQTLGLKSAAALEGIGNEQQNQGQKSADLAYQDFLNQTQYPQQQVGFLSNIIRGIAAPTSTTSTQTGPASQSQLAPNPLSQVLGTGIGITGLLSQMGYKQGGKVANDRIKGIGMDAPKKQMSRARKPAMARGIGQMRMAA